MARNALTPISAKLRSTATPRFKIRIDQARPVAIGRRSKIPTHPSERRQAFSSGRLARIVIQ
ncbi:hypothetical protein CEE69_26365 [Rhodopirellula bahusiensis]|uniref:Uncharacterized protein n=1 Tax=Rhodopirellula bahusiensis TaxID=2014065 RepID=A0A2G1W0S5_9BACT|nr:hypothetical protein CEE69_26365 [Rhodopirellula bahusiensis]